MLKVELLEERNLFFSEQLNKPVKEKATEVELWFSLLNYRKLQTPSFSNQYHNMCLICRSSNLMKVKFSKTISHGISFNFSIMVLWHEQEIKSVME